MRQLTIERLTLWILFILLFTMATRVPVDTDTWWHLRSGETMLDEGKILREDVFSHTQNGDEWINHSWLSQLFFALAYRVTGGAGETTDSGTIGLAFLTAFLATAGMAFVYRMCGGNTYVRAFVVVLGAATAAVFWSPRPQMFSFLLSTVILYILYLYKFHQKNYLWGIPLLMMLWVNLHSGFAIGFILLFGFLVGEIVGQFFNPEESIAWREIGKLGLITGISILALAINPYGIRMILYPFETAGLQTLNLFIQEWQSPNFKIPQTWPFLVLLAALITFAIVTSKRLAWSEVSLLVGTLLLALWAGRNIAVFAIVAAPALSRLVDAYLDQRGWQLRPMKSVKGTRLILNWMLLGVVLLGGLTKISSDLLTENVTDIQEEFLPLAAVAYLEQNPPQGNLLNSYNWGGLLIFLLPDVPVFVDGRTDLYGDAFLQDYFTSYLGGSEWREIFEKYDIQTVMLEDENALATLLREDSEQWQIVYEDDQAVIFEKVSTGE